MKSLFFVVVSAAVLAVLVPAALADKGQSSVAKVKITLLSPAATGLVAQNDPATGCTADPVMGYGLIVHFSWRATHHPAVSAYELYVKHPSAAIPLVHQTSLTEASYTFMQCPAYVAGTWLEGWQWRVRAFDAQGNATDWKEGTFNFAPCVLADGKPCGSS